MVIAGLLVYLTATSLTGSTSHRAVARSFDLRLVVGAGESAIHEAISMVREGLAAGQPIPLNWREALRPPCNPPPKAHLAPLGVRALFEPLGVSVDDVQIRVCHSWFGAPERGRPPPLPQGVLELSVVVEAKRAVYHVKRTLLQRRSYYLTSHNREQPWPQLKPEDIDVWISSKPLGTVLRP